MLTRSADINFEYSVICNYMCRCGCSFGSVLFQRDADLFGFIMPGQIVLFNVCIVLSLLVGVFVPHVSFLELSR